MLPEREVLSAISKHRSEGKTIVFTNGCFDLLHPGHIKLLEFAKSKGDILVVGLNTDDSVRRLKGETRPIVGEKDRAIVLSALEHVDYVVLFDEDTPLKLIEKVLPHVLVKGQDYTRETVVGHEIVEGHGGRVELSPLVEGLSTSKIVDRVKRRHDTNYE